MWKAHWNRQTTKQILIFIISMSGMDYLLFDIEGSFKRINVFQRGQHLIASVCVGGCSLGCTLGLPALIQLPDSPQPRALASEMQGNLNNSLGQT